jgi:hypothetical protein
MGIFNKINWKLYVFLNKNIFYQVLFFKVKDLVSYEK